MAARSLGINSHTFATGGVGKPVTPAPPSVKKGKTMSRESEIEIQKRFTYHAPKSGQPQKYETIRGAAKEVALLIDRTCPESREKALALTKLQEVAMWAIAAIACRE